MVEWILNVDVNLELFPEYKKLVEELKKIPDTAVWIHLDYAISDPAVRITITSLKGKHTTFTVLTYNKGKGEVGLMILYSHRRPPYEGRKASVKNNEEAIPYIVDFMRDALSKVARNTKYLTKTDKGDDISKIKVVELKVSPENFDFLEFTYFLEELEDCENIRRYNFDMLYAYPHIAREVWGAILCCPNQCYLFITKESEGGKIYGGKVVIIDLNGRKPSKETLEEILKTRTDLLMDIERYIRETLEKQSK
ncbi:MAG: hypothetical protein JZD40_03800 [Sulfolobus sp.]|nr:hypothetical protein [Sulfolobus sp.]